MTSICIPTDFLGTEYDFAWSVFKLWLIFVSLQMEIKDKQQKILT